MAAPSEKSTISIVKAWVFPIVLGVLAWIIKTDISEMKSDIKALLAQSNIDKTKIEHLENDVNALNKAVFKISGNTSKPANSKLTQFSEMVYAKPEDFYDIKKQLNLED